MDDRGPKPSLADDPNFLDSLSDLDRGLAGHDQSEAANVHASSQPVVPAPPQRPIAPRTLARPTPAPIVAPPPQPSAVSLPEPPPWVPPTAAAAINAASAALSATFESPAPSTIEAPPPLAQPAQASGARSPRPLLDLFPLASSREVTAPGLPVRESTPAPPAIAALEPPRVAVKPRVPPSAPVRPAPLTYETFYGLDEKPFAPLPDLRFLYHSSARDNALQELVSSIDRRDALALLTGPAGIGKTLLCRALVDQLDRRTIVSLIENAPASAEQLLRTMLVDVGVVSQAEAASGSLSSASREDLERAFRDYLGSLTALQATALLIVDDVDRLGPAVMQELRTLSELAASGQLLQIVLVGEPSLTRQLRSGDFQAIDERVAVRVQLGPLERDEVSGYVAHRLAVAGRGERVDFSEPALDKIFALSDGVPGAVNQICDKALTLGYQLSASRIDGDFVEDAAQQLGWSAAEGVSSWGDRLLIAALMLALVLVGAAAAGWIFHEQLSRAWASWR